MSNIHKMHNILQCFGTLLLHLLPKVNTFPRFFTKLHNMKMSQDLAKICSKHFSKPYSISRSISSVFFHVTHFHINLLKIHMIYRPNSKSVRITLVPSITHTKAQRFPKALLKIRQYNYKDGVRILFTSSKIYHILLMSVSRT